MLESANENNITMINIQLKISHSWILNLVFLKIPWVKRRNKYRK